MPNHLFIFLLEVVSRKHDKDWVLSEIHRRITQIRADAVFVNQRIPAYFDQATLSELDDILTAAWFMTACASIDRQCLLELDVLGAALEFAGCQTRLGYHVRDAIADMGLANPWQKESDSFWEEP